MKMSLIIPLAANLFFLIWMWVFIRPRMKTQLQFHEAQANIHELQYQLQNRDKLVSELTERLVKIEAKYSVLSYGPDHVRNLMDTGIFVDNIQVYEDAKRWLNRI